MRLSIACDFDGTIALGDVTDILFEQFAAPAWRDIEAEWRAGRIGSRECLLRQVALLRAPLAAIDAVLDGVRIDPGFPAFVALVRRHGAELRVVSDGLDYAIRRILGRHGLGDLPVVANRLEALDGDRYRLFFPHASHGCTQRAGTCKCRAAAAAEPPDALRILIGDGASDFCAATAAHLVLAKDSLLAHCRTHHLPHAAFADFTEATRLLRGLLERRPMSSPLSLEMQSE